ncbi:lariat debranching enzyme, C-terminal domain-containing protein [Schizothecium vesticola]|uniref:Lariat debranching enzyme, C-terminal domain-containing protein n=1 Tax=Schizothecium vesticola TaxID=314040 RepID=A0AA40EJX3_9PEZI|nr:lariat debranching enzyme, C-terminal domain-containing protein [Schizothecium vesticola]
MDVPGDAFEADGVRVAIEGCGHGTLNAIYASVAESCKHRGWDGVDVLLIGGDFQAVRNAADLNVMSVPAKYRDLADFHEFYSGVRTAPYLTLFVAGNHEAASHLWELYYGGWVAPNIYYLGAANVLRVGPLRIAGMSGIWKGFDYRKPHHERLPFNYGDTKSFYHVREFDVRKLLQLRTQVDVGMSHDWPRAIEKHGNQRHLFNMKPDFERESRDGSLGNPAAEYVMDRLRPPYWFSAHLHCKFSAIKTYDPPTAASNEPAVDPPQTQPAPVPAAIPDPNEIDLDMDDSPPAPAAAPPPPAAPNPDEIDLDMDDASTSIPAPAPQPTPTPTADETEALRSQLPAAFARPAHHPATPRTTPGQPVPPTITNTTVRFLALDKCLPGRKFLQLASLPSISPPPPPTTTTTTTTHHHPGRHPLTYDPEWLAITRVFAADLAIGTAAPPPPDQGEAHYRPLIEDEEAWVARHVADLAVPDNFAVTAPVHVAGRDPETTEEQPVEYTNPQTAVFCALVGVPNLWDGNEEERRERRERGPAAEEFRGGGFGGGGRGRGRGGGGGRGFSGGRGGGRGRGGGGGRGRGRGRGW